MDKLQASIDRETLLSTTSVTKNDDDIDKITFSPPVFEQRYHRVVNLLELFSSQMNHIVEFGVAEMRNFTITKNTLKSAKTFDLVDIDRELLETYKNRVNPLTCDFLDKREVELTVNIWRGSVAVFNPNFTDVDAVIAIELIEHVYPDVLEELPYVIFGQIHPKLVCVTTPNGEFNVLFGLADGEFRHWDHKFEWTREQFEDWGNNMCARFPEYSVAFTGIGRAPTEFVHLGCVSQMAAFVRKDLLAQLEEEEARQAKIAEIETVDDSPKVELMVSPDYEIIHTVKYPFYKDPRSRQDKITDEIRYQLGQLRHYTAYYNNDSNRIEIPIDHIIDACYKVSENSDEIKRVIATQNFVVDGDLLILECPERQSDNESDDYDDEEDEQTPENDNERNEENVNQE